MAPTRSTARAAPDDPASRDHTPTEAELVAIWNACGDDDFGRIVRLLILLGNRRQEVGGMRWSELDLAAGTWTLPSRAQQKSPIAYRGIAAAGAGDHPVGAANEPRLLVRRSRRCRIHRMDQRQGGTGSPARQHGQAVAPARSPTGRRDWLDRYRHRTASSSKRVLNHHTGHRAGVAGIYNARVTIAQIAAALARWSEHVLALIEGRESKIVTLQRA